MNLSPIATHIPDNVPPRSISTRLDMPVWDSELPIEGQKLDAKLEAIFRMPSIRESGDFNRSVVHEVASGWAKRIDDLEALRGAILAVAPHSARSLTDAVRVGRNSLATLQAADQPAATRAQLEAADTAMNVTHHAIGEVRWGVPAAIRAVHYIRPGDVARSRVQQFDTDGDRRIREDEYTLKRRENEMVFDEPRTFEQTFNAYRLFKPADEQGAADGVTTVTELEAFLTRWDGNDDGFITQVEFDDFEARGDAELVDQRVVGPTFPEFPNP